MAQNIKNDLTVGPVWKKLLFFFFPIVVGMLFQQLYNTVDAIIVGKFVGTEALAAVGGSSSAIVNLVIGFFTGIGTGVTVVIAQLFGAKNRVRLNRSVHTAITFYFIVGFILTIVGYFIAPWALKLVNDPEELETLSTAYLRIYFCGSIPLLIFNVGSGIMRAVGDSKRPLYFLATCCFVNIALDLLFVVVFDWGVAGAGWATVIAQMVSAVLVIISLSKSKEPHGFSIKKVGINFLELKNMLRIGIPTGLQSSMYNISNLIIQAAVNGLGTAVVAAWSASSKIDGIYWVISNSFGAAICAFAGQCFGAAKYDRLKKGVKTTLILQASVSVVLATLLLSFGKLFLRIITDDTQVIDYSYEMMTYFAPFYIIWTFIEVLSNTLHGVGDSIRTMIMVTLGTCLTRILWVAFVFPKWHTVMGISMAYGMSWTITAIIMVTYYLKSNWLKRSITKTNIHS